MSPVDLERLDWAKGDGLLPAIVQDASSGAVLMLGYMDREALAQTLATGLVTFFSRSRRALWVKGETSGNRLRLRALHADCDGDAILVQADPAGPVCHAGTASCFADAPAPAAAPLAFLADLEAVIDSRIADSPTGSYTAKLHAQGPRRIAQKVGEEGVEFALAAAGGSDEDVTAEAADLLFHLMLALRARGLSLGEVTRTLKRRHSVARGIRLIAGLDAGIPGP
jgi:phosphoribosyl-AMP cyclohydrolase / phosphoribosyl-ATP pyrophosphohydrolase